MDIIFSIQNQRLRCRSADVYVEGSRDYLNAVFEVSEDWNDCTITVFFQHKDSEDIIARILEPDFTCKVPTQVIEDGEVKVWARGDTSAQTITTNEVTITIYNTGDFDVGADLYNQVISMMRDTKDMANAAVNGAGGALESAERAEAAAQEVEEHAALVSEDRKAVEELVEQVLSQSISWDEIKNKPTEFTPEAHKHEISDILDLEERLNQLKPEGTAQVREIRVEDGISVLHAMRTMPVGLAQVWVEAGCVDNPGLSHGDLSGVVCVNELHDEDCYYGWILLIDERGRSFTRSVTAGRGSAWRLSNASGASYEFGSGLSVDEENGMVSLSAATAERIGGIIVGDGLYVDESGKLKIQSVNIDQLTPGDAEIIINGGSANGQ